MIWDLQIIERDGVRVHRSRLEPGESSRGTSIHSTG